MVDLASFASAISSLKTAGDITKALVGLHDAQIVQSKVIELNGIILSAQQSALAAQSDQFTLLEQVRNLEAQIVKLEAWNAEKQRYELTDVGVGVFTYIVKPSMKGAQPIHCICSECFERGHKSILQQEANTYGSVTLKCPKCKTGITASEDHPNYPFRREHAPQPPADDETPGGDFMTR
jgi:phage FluMu protein Com